MKRAAMMAVAVAALAANTPASAQSAPRLAAQGCWSRPVPQTLTEIAEVLDNSQAVSAQKVGRPCSARACRSCTVERQDALRSRIAGRMGRNRAAAFVRVVTAVGTSAIIALLRIPWR